MPSPSVATRQTTTVFGVVKGGGGDTGRVLRSGRQLWPDSANVSDDRRKKPAKTNLHNDGSDRFYGKAYSRKRKRNVENNESEIFRIQRQRMKDPCKIAVIVKPCSEDIGLFSCFLFMVLRTVVMFGLTFEDLAAFVLSEPICSVYASRGIQFLQGSVTANVGICQFFGVTRFIPLFCVDFSAVPQCFTSLHSAVVLRYMFRSFFLACNLVNVAIDIEDGVDLSDFEMELQISCDSFMKETSEIENISITPEVIEIDGDLSLHESVTSSKLAGRNGQRHSMNARRIQMRRTSPRIREAQNPSTKNMSNSELPFDSKGGREKSSAGVASNKKPRHLTNSCTSLNLSEAKSVMDDSKEAIDSSFCSANILIVESDRCYRVEGAVVTSEETPKSGEWHLAVKKDGLTQCTLKADKIMRPCSSNRYTHVKMVSLINGWKLEFANRQNWLAFKNLYKECSEREIPIPAAKYIPVPGVCEVSDYADSYTVPFNRPDSYISTDSDEFYRAMTCKTAIYDMDSGDEDWVSKFNKEFQEHVSEDDFESIVDALEKTYHYNPDDCCDEKTVIYWCKNLVSKKAVEAVHGYWMRKRKHNHSSLLRIFQSYQSKISPFVLKPSLRKKRSFKRHPSQINRSENPNVLQVAAEVEAAKAAANESTELAIQKRKEAQSLAENADLAVYKATMLVRMTEATQAGGSVDALAGQFLD